MLRLWPPVECRAGQGDPRWRRVLRSDLKSLRPHCPHDRLRIVRRDKPESPILRLQDVRCAGGGFVILRHDFPSPATHATVGGGVQTQREIGPVRR